MKIELLDMDQFIDLNHLKAVTSPVLFQRGDVPHPEGLISNEIFGITTKTRKTTFAYIDLHGHYFHPHVYKVVKSLFRAVDSIINGSEYYSINENGILVKDPNGETGIEFLYKNWNKLKWEQKDDVKGGTRFERITLLNITPRSIAFITKLDVIPAFYRDITSSTSGGGETSELNNFYTNIIRSTSSVAEQSMFGFSLYTTNYNVQQQIVNIYEYFKVKLEKKRGMFRKYLMGKNVDNSVRSVITAPSFHGNTVDDLMITYEYAGVPISQACACLYPFVVYWLKNFFNREFILNKYTKLVWNPNNPDSQSMIELDSPETYFNDKYIKNMIDSYIRNPESRFDPIEIPVKGSNKKQYMVFTGKRFHDDSTEDISTIANRKMTITDLLYMACVDVSKDKYCMITRYPVNDAFGIFVNKVRILSTCETEVVRINDEVYKWYPKIQPNTPKEEIVNKFYDSLQFSNAYLEGIGGDYDGDQVTLKIPWTQESNKELSEYMKKKSFFLNTSGSNVRKIGSEASQTFYTFTKDPSSKSKRLNQSDIEFITGLTKEKYTFENMALIFGRLSNNEELMKRGFRNFKCNDILELPANLSPTKQKIETTVGRYVLYRWVIEFNGLSDIVPFFNYVITDKKFGAIDKMISSALLSEKITTDDMVKWIDTRDWIGLQMHAIITTSFSPAVLDTDPEVRKLREKLIKENEKELDKGNTRVSEMIENKLIAKTMDILKDDYGLDIYVSGARGSVGNNLKNMNLFRGSVKDPSTGKYTIVKTALMDGMAKEDIPASSNTIVNGAYPKSCATADSGYLAKEILAALQTEVLDDAGTDCGTLRTIDITITEGNKKDFLYRYIKEGNRLICLEPDVINKYVGKTVKLRSPLMCVGKKICNHCAGDMYYRLGIKNVGLTASKVATTLTNLNMKKFHENLVKTTQIDVNDMLI